MHRWSPGLPPPTKDGWSGRSPSSEFKPGYLAEFIIKSVDKKSRRLKVELTQVPAVEGALQDVLHALADLGLHACIAATLSFAAVVGAVAVVLLAARPTFFRTSGRR